MVIVHFLPGKVHVVPLIFFRLVKLLNLQLNHHECTLCSVNCLQGKIFILNSTKDDVTTIAMRIKYTLVPFWSAVSEQSRFYCMPGAKQPKICNIDINLSFMNKTLLEGKKVPLVHSKK